MTVVRIGNKKNAFPLEFEFDAEMDAFNFYSEAKDPLLSFRELHKTVTNLSKSHHIFNNIITCLNYLQVSIKSPYNSAKSMKFYPLENSIRWARFTMIRTLPSRVSYQCNEWRNWRKIHHYLAKISRNRYTKFRGSLTNCT